MSRPTGTWDDGTDFASSAVLLAVASVVLAATAPLHWWRRRARPRIADRLRTASPAGCPARIACRWPACDCPADQPADTGQASPIADYDGAIAKAEADAAGYHRAAEARRRAGDPVAAADLDWQAGRALELADRYRRTRDGAAVSAQAGEGSR